VHITLVQREILLFALRKLKKQLLLVRGVPIFTSDHERRMYSVLTLIHHMA